MKRMKFLKHKKGIFVAAGGILLLVLAAGTVFKAKDNTDEDIIWREYQVERGDITASLDGSGKLEFTGVSHSFDVDLKIERSFVEVGQEVKKGDKLVQYSEEEIKKQIEERKRTLETAERSLQDIKNTQQVERLQNSLNAEQNQQTEQNAYETSKREYESSIQALEQNVGQLQNTVDSLKQALKDAEESEGEDLQSLHAKLEQLKIELAELETSDQKTVNETNSTEMEMQGEDNTAEIQEKQEQTAEIQEEIESAYAKLEQVQIELETSDQETVNETNSTEMETQNEDNAEEIQAKREQIAEIQQKIESVSAKENQIVGLKEQISQVQGELEAAKSQLEAQRTALANLKADYDKQNAQNAQKQNIQNQIDALNNIGKDNAVKNAQAEVDKARADLEEVEALLNIPLLTAKTDGVVTAINYMPGDDVPAGKSIITIGDDGDKRVIVQISQEDIGSIEVGQQVEMHFLANSQEVVYGTVFEKALLPTEGGDGVTYKVIISLDEDQVELMEGMTCSVKFILRRVEGVLTLANKAITLQDGKQYVTIRLSDGSYEEREIKTGFSDGRVSEVISGLSEGDTVVVAG